MIAIVDDSREDAQILADMLSRVPETAHVEVRMVQASALGYLVRAGDIPEILFIDIQLGEGDDARSGIELVERLQGDAPMMAVVYMSGYDRYHTRVYRTEHAAYLRKPFEQEDVAEAVRLVQAARSRVTDRPLLIRVHGKEVVIAPRDISHIESHLRMVRVHAGEETVEAYGKLSDLESRLPPHFVRSHQSFLVNLDYVADLGTSEVHLTTGDTLPVSRRCRPALKEALFAHIRGGC